MSSFGEEGGNAYLGAIKRATHRPQSHRQCIRKAATRSYSTACVAFGTRSQQSLTRHASLSSDLLLLLVNQHQEAPDAAQPFPLRRWSRRRLSRAFGTGVALSLCIPWCIACMAVWRLRSLPAPQPLLGCWLKLSVLTDHNFLHEMVACDACCVLTCVHVFALLLAEGGAGAVGDDKDPVAVLFFFSLWPLLAHFGGNSFVDVV